MQPSHFFNVQKQKHENTTKTSLKLDIEPVIGHKLPGYWEVHFWASISRAIATQVQTLA